MVAAIALVTALHASIALSGYETLPVFIVLQALTMACFAFTSSNMSTLAMEHMPHIAGTASSVQGVIGTIGAAIIGFAIGQQFDGTPVPFLIGTALCASGGFLAIVLTHLATMAERRIDRLVHPDLNQGLPPFLSPNAGVNSGFMMAQVTAAALASECKVLSHPASVDTIPTDGSKEDVVPMAMGAAWKARR